jgi:hypothetical protein
MVHTRVVAGDGYGAQPRDFTEKLEGKKIAIIGYAILP